MWFLYKVQLQRNSSGKSYEHNIWFEAHKKVEHFPKWMYLQSEFAPNVCLTRKPVNSISSIYSLKIFEEEYLKPFLFWDVCGEISD